MSISLGDDKLINELFKKYKQMMYKEALSIVKNPVNAEDAVQSAFVRVCANIENILQRSPKDREGYLIKTIKSVCCEFLKSEERRRSSNIEELEISTGNSVEDTAILNMTAEEIKDSLKCLSPRDRDILYFLLFMDYAPKNIARILRISERNINTYISRARKRLIKVLRKRGITNDL